MNNQTLFVSVILLSVSVAFLFYQNMKLSRKLDQQYNAVNKNMSDLSHMIALNNNITVNGGAQENVSREVNLDDENQLSSVSDSNEMLLNPSVTPEFAQEINQLKNEYQDYELSSELKDEIDNLQRMENMENMPESLELNKENLEELQKAQMENIDAVAVGEGDGEELESMNTNELLNGENEDEGSEEHGGDGAGEEEGSEEHGGEGEDQREENFDTSLVEEELPVSNDLQIETLEDEDIENFDNQIVDEETLVDEISLNPPASISLDSSDIKAEVSQGVNELVGNIIAAASDVETPENTETTIKLNNDGDNISVNINNEQRALEELNGTELKEVCKHFNLKAKGKKIELVERIKDYQLNLKNSKNFFVLN